MRELRDVVDAWSDRRGETFVLGTVVDVAGSSYRKPGARMLVHRDGSRVGLISGGCLERDVVRRAFEWTADGPRTVLFDTRSQELHTGGPYGTGCEGIVKLLLERVEPGAESPMPVLAQLLGDRESTVSATIFAADGAPDLVARRVTGGEGAATTDDLPESVAAELRAVLDEASDWSRPKTVTFEAADIEAKALVEPLRPPIELVIFGAGDDVRPVAALADDLGWDLRIADAHPSLATADRFPQARRIVCEPPAIAVDKLTIGPRSHVLLMTHDFDADAVLLPELLETDAPFVGLLGPRSRTRRLMKRLRADGRLPEPDALDRLQTPLGLHLGGEAPSEVALSIVSAVLAADRGASGVPLQEREGRIHRPHERLERGSESTP